MLIYCRVAGGDEFIANLWKVHLRVKEEGYVQVCVSRFRLLESMLLS